MGNDVVIQYNAKLIEVKDNIKQLETLQIKTDKYKMAIENIQVETDAEVQKCYQDYHKADSSCFLEEALTNTYANAIKSLDKINHHIVSQYEIYYKIKLKTDELIKKTDKVDPSKIRELVEEIFTLLKKIKTSTSVDYEEEKDIVENVYALVYKMIKLELIYTNNSSLLEWIKSDSVDVSYIVKLIKEDIKNSDEENEELMNKVQEIDKNGFDDIHFLNKELILLLSVIGNDDLTETVKNTFLSKIKNYDNLSDRLSRVKNGNEKTNNQIKIIKKDNKNIFWKILGKRTFFFLNLGFLISAIIGSVVGIRNITKTKEYKTVTTNYDSSMPELDSTTIEYLTDISNSRTLVEYSPWEDPGYFRDEYTRNVYTYDLSNLEVYYDEVTDYLTSDIKEYITVTSGVEYSSEKPEEDYSENKYVIHQVFQDKNDYREVDNPAIWALFSVITSIGIISIDACLISRLSKFKLKDLKQLKKDNEVELSEQQQLLLETKTYMDELTGQLFTLKKDIQNDYEALPTTLQQNNKIKKKMLTLEEEK